MSEEHGRSPARGRAAACRCRAFALMRAVVFAYHNVGCAACRCCSAHGVDVALVVTHDDNPGENIWFDSVERAGAAARSARHHAGGPERPADFVAPVRALAPGFPVLVLLPADAVRRHCSRSRRAAPQHARLAAAEVPRPRAGQLGRDPRASAKPAPRCTTWSSKPDAGDIVDQQAVPILPDDTAVEVFGKVTVAAELVLDRALPGLLAGTRTRHAAGPDPRALLRRPQARRTAASTGAGRAAAIHNLVRGVAPPYPGAFTRGRGRHGARAAHPAAAGPARPLRPPGAVLRSGPLLCRMRRRRAAARPAPRGGRYNAVRRDLSARRHHTARAAPIQHRPCTCHMKKI